MSELRDELMTPAQYAKFDAYRRGKPAPSAPDNESGPAGQQKAETDQADNGDQRPADGQGGDG